MTFEKTVESAFRAPAVALEQGVEAAGRAQKALVSKRPFKLAEEYINTLGPGLTTGAADDDPSGIATYSQAGAQFGTHLLWMALFTFPLMAVVQEMCAKIGIVTGKGLAANIRTHYSRRVLFVCAGLLFVANSFNLGADLGAMAKATELLFPTISFTLLVLAFGLVSLFLQVFTTYARYAKYLKYLTFALFSYVAAALIVPANWHAVLSATLVPTLSFSRGEILLVCAILGTTISPYLFFWQTSQEVEEGVLRGQQGTPSTPHVGRDLWRMRLDVWSGMFLSNLVMFFIIVACASAFAAHGITNITTADQAAAALKPLAGEWAYLLFALGIVGTGLLAIPTLSGAASYAISESFRWETGLYRKLKEAYAFYGVIIVSMVVGMVINFTGIDPIKALIYSAVANGLIAPVVLVLIVRLSSNRELMGRHTSGALARSLGWVTIVLMALSGIAAVATLIS